MAPNCIEMINKLRNGLDLSPSAAEARIICPVEETGRNSVRPSTSAMINASK
jgi:hypothetical protein